MRTGWEAEDTSPPGEAIPKRASLPRPDRRYHARFCATGVPPGRLGDEANRRRRSIGRLPMGAEARTDAGQQERP